MGAAGVSGRSAGGSSLPGVNRCGEALLERCEPEELDGSPEEVGPPQISGRGGQRGGVQRSIGGHLEEKEEIMDGEDGLESGGQQQSLFSLGSSPWWGGGGRRRVAACDARVGGQSAASAAASPSKFFRSTAGSPSEEPPPLAGRKSSSALREGGGPGMILTPGGGGAMAGGREASGSPGGWQRALRCFTAEEENDHDERFCFTDDVDERIFQGEDKILSFRELVPEYTPEGALYYLMKDYREHVRLRREALACVRKLRTAGRLASKSAAEATRDKELLAEENAELRAQLEAAVKRGDEFERQSADFLARFRELEGANDDISNLLTKETYAHQRLQERYHAAGVSLRQTRARSERLKTITVNRSMRTQKELKQIEQRYMMLSMDHQANTIASRMKYDELTEKLETAKARAKEVDDAFLKQRGKKEEARAEIKRLKAEIELTQTEKRKLWDHINTLNSAWEQEMRLREAQNRG